jgi:hypothetical protein
VDGEPKTAQRRRYRSRVFCQYRCGGHEKKGSQRRNKRPENVHIVFLVYHQKRANQAPSEEQKGVMEVGHREMREGYIPINQKEAMQRERYGRKRECETGHLLSGLEKVEKIT